MHSSLYLSWLESIGIPFDTFHWIYSHIYRITTINVTKQDMLFFRVIDPKMFKRGWKSHSTPSITLGLIDTYLVFILICWKSRKTSMILVFGNKTRHTHFLCKHGFLMIFHNLKCFPIHSFRGTNYIMHCKHDESMKTLNLWFYKGM